MSATGGGTSATTIDAVAFVAVTKVRRHWRTYVAAGLLLAATLGTAVVAIAGARRTQSAYPRFLRSVRASTLSVTSAGGFEPAVTARIASLPEVERSRTYVGVDVTVRQPHRRALTSMDIESFGTFDGRYFDQDRVVATEGRTADVHRRDEIVVNEFAAHRFGLHVGDRVDLAVYSLAQITDPSFLDHPPVPKLHTAATIVGVVVFPDEVLQDDGDRATRLLVTPSFTRWAKAYVTYSVQGLVLHNGSRDVDAVERRITRFVDPSAIEFRTTADDAFHAQHALRPMTIALASFGVIVGIAGLVLVAQALARIERSEREEHTSLRALGMRPRAMVLVTMTGPALAIATGIAALVVYAALASPLMPIGPVHRVEPARGLQLDLTVVAAVAVVALVVLGGFSFVVAIRHASRRAGRGGRRGAGLKTEAALGRVNLPVVVVTGFRQAFGPAPTSRSTTRAVALGGVIAVASLVGAVVFGSSLRALTDEPRLYGWTGDAAVIASQGYGNIAVEPAGAIFRRDRAVAAWSGAYFGSATIGGREVPILGMRPGSTVGPALLRGRSIANAGEIVLGQATARQLHAQVGARVVFRGAGPPARLRVAGIATFPTIGPVHVAHTSLGVGALVVPARVPGADLDLTGRRGRNLGPHVVFVRLRNGVNVGRELTRLRREVQPLGGFAGIDALPVQRPAEIVNSSQMGAAPVVLGGALALGAAASLGLALAAAVRQRRRELTLLKTLGFTRRQLAATVAWQATATTALALAVGVPIGVLAGRRLWTAFAHQLDVVTQPASPARALLLIVLAALAVANLVAAAPARAARNVRASTLLRAE